MQPIQRRGLYLIVLLAGIAWIYASADRSGASTDGRIPAPQKGFLAPDFSLPDPRGNHYQLSALKGKAVIVNLWATWCPPCRAEMPEFERVYTQYQSRGLVVLGVDATSQDYPLNVVPFIQEFGITFPVLLDETGEVGRKYQLQSLPSTYFINPDGTVAEVVIGGPISGVVLQTYIEEILGKTAH